MIANTRKRPIFVDWMDLAGWWIWHALIHLPWREKWRAVRFCYVANLGMRARRTLEATPISHEQ